MLSAERLSLHEFPNPLNQVEVRRIRWQEQQLNVQRLRFLLHQRTTLIARIVHHHRNRSVGIFLLDRLQKLTYRQRIDIGNIDYSRQLLGNVIQGPQYIVPLTPRRRPQEESSKAPQIAQKSTKDKMAGVDEKILRLPCSA